MSSISSSFYASPASAFSTSGALGKTQAHSQTNKSAQKTGSDDNAISQFLAYQQLTPQQKLREAILQKYNLTEETLQNLPTAERKKIEDDIKVEIEKQIKNNMVQKGILVDFLA